MRTIAVVALLMAVGAGSIFVPTASPREGPPWSAAALTSTVGVGPPVVAGCEFRDCFPLTQVQTTVSWRMTVTGPPGASVSLAFDSQADSLGTLPLEGPAVWDSSGLRVRVGISTLRNLPVSPAGRPVVATPAAFISTGTASAAPAIQLAVEQMADGATVAHYSYTWPKLPAPVPYSACKDVIELNGKPPGQEAFFVLDGQAEKCWNDRVYGTAGTFLSLDNLLTPGQACRSEVSVFSPLSAMALKHLKRWTAACGDRESVTLRDAIVVPVQFWIARPPKYYETNYKASVEETARRDLQRANDVLQDMTVGVRFKEKGMTNVVAQAPDGEADCEGDKWLNIFRSKWYQPEMLNVYYARGTQPTGCTVQVLEDEGLRNAVLILGDDNRETLAHELGHTLRLAVYWKQEGLLGNGNIMSDGSERDCLTLGQAFRANVDPKSIVNRLRLRQGEPIRKCRYTLDSDDRCPSIALDDRVAMQGWLFSSCGIDASYATGESNIAFRALLDWFNCDGCHEGELEAVVRLGRPALSPLATVLENGPSTPELVAYNLHLRNAEHDVSRSTDVGSRPNGPIGSEAYVGLNKARFDYRYRVRAATAIARIGGAEARAALRHALNLGLPAGIRDRIQVLLQNLPTR